MCYLSPNVYVPRADARSNKNGKPFRPNYSASPLPRRVRPFTKNNDNTCRGMLAEYYPGIVPDIPCAAAAYSGGEGVTNIVVDLGTATGRVTLLYNAYSVPDEFAVYWGIPESIKIHTGMVGDDGYGIPVVGPGEGSASFIKTLPWPTTATVRVTAPYEGTGWEFILTCPEPL